MVKRSNSLRCKARSTTRKRSRRMRYRSSEQRDLIRDFQEYYVPRHVRFQTKVLKKLKEEGANNTLLPEQQAYIASMREVIEFMINNEFEFPLNSIEPLIEAILKATLEAAYHKAPSHLTPNDIKVIIQTHLPEKPAAASSGKRKLPAASEQPKRETSEAMARAAIAAVMAASGPSQAPVLKPGTASGSPRFKPEDGTGTTATWETIFLWNNLNMSLQIKSPRLGTECIIELLKVDGRIMDFAEYYDDTANHSWTHGVWRVKHTHSGTKASYRPVPRSLWEFEDVTGIIGAIKLENTGAGQSFHVQLNFLGPTSSKLQEARVILRIRAPNGDTLAVTDTFTVKRRPKEPHKLVKRQ